MTMVLGGKLLSTHATDSALANETVRYAAATVDSKVLHRCLAIIVLGPVVLSMQHTAYCLSFAKLVMATEGCDH